MVSPELFPPPRVFCPLRGASTCYPNLCAWGTGAECIVKVALTTHATAALGFLRSLGHEADPPPEAVEIKAILFAACIPGCCRIRIAYYDKRPLQTSAGLLDVQVISSTP